MLASPGCELEQVLPSRVAGQSESEMGELQGDIAIESSPGDELVELEVGIFYPAGLIGGFYMFTQYVESCLLYTSPSPRDRTRCRMPSSA